MKLASADISIAQSPFNFAQHLPNLAHCCRISPAISNNGECRCEHSEEPWPAAQGARREAAERSCTVDLMAFSPPPTALESYIDIPFNIWLSIILIFTYGCAIRNRVLLLLVVVVVSATIVAFDRKSTVGEMTKVMCELPLGLGSVLAFLVANQSFQARFLPAFTTYVNFAVYGNIGMMVGTPADGTFRGVCSKVTCIALFIWIIQQGQRAGWKTVSVHDNLFVFTAVSKSWVFAHASYRFVLLTLPCFGSGRRHRLLELYSLALTFTLSSTSGLPFEYCFGMADTLVVPAAAGWSAIATMFNLIPGDGINSNLISNRTGTDADACLGALSLAVAIFACFKIFRAQRQW
jgi:hypothetical protein